MTQVREQLGLLLSGSQLGLDLGQLTRPVLGSDQRWLNGLQVMTGSLVHPVLNETRSPQRYDEHHNDAAAPYMRSPLGRLLTIAGGQKVDQSNLL
jgi:hypothetical protein